MCLPDDWVSVRDLLWENPGSDFLLVSEAAVKCSGISLCYLLLSYIYYPLTLASFDDEHILNSCRLIRSEPRFVEILNSVTWKGFRSDVQFAFGPDCSVILVNKKEKQ